MVGRTGVVHCRFHDSLFFWRFISCFIGNELILSGLRGEKRLTEKAEGELQNEVRAVSDIQEALKNIESQMGQLETKMRDHHKT